MQQVPLQRNLLAGVRFARQPRDAGGCLELTLQHAAQVVCPAVPHTLGKHRHRRQVRYSSNGQRHPPSNATVFLALPNKQVR